MVLVGSSGLHLRVATLERPRTTQLPPGVTGLQPISSQLSTAGRHDIAHRIDRVHLTHRSWARQDLGWAVDQRHRPIRLRAWLHRARSTLEPSSRMRTCCHFPAVAPAPTAVVSSRPSPPVAPSQPPFAVKLQRVCDLEQRPLAGRVTGQPPFPSTETFAGVTAAHQKRWCCTVKVDD